MCTNNEHSTRGNDQRARTLTPDDLHPHAGVLVPVDRVELDEASDDGLVEVGVLHGVRVRVTFKHLWTQIVECCVISKRYVIAMHLACWLLCIFTFQFE